MMNYVYYIYYTIIFEIQFFSFELHFVLTLDDELT